MNIKLCWFTLQIYVYISISHLSLWCQSFKSEPSTLYITKLINIFFYRTPSYYIPPPLPVLKNTHIFNYAYPSKTLKNICILSNVILKHIHIKFCWITFQIYVFISISKVKHPPWSIFCFLCNTLIFFRNELNF